MLSKRILKEAWECYANCQPTAPTEHEIGSTLSYSLLSSRVFFFGLDSDKMTTGNSQTYCGMNDKPTLRILMHFYSSAIRPSIIGASCGSLGHFLFDPYLLYYPTKFEHETLPDLIQAFPLYSTILAFGFLNELVGSREQKMLKEPYYFLFDLVSSEWILKRVPQISIHMLVHHRKSRRNAGF